MKDRRENNDHDNAAQENVSQGDRSWLVGKARCGVGGANQGCRRIGHSCKYGITHRRGRQGQPGAAPGARIAKQGPGAERCAGKGRRVGHTYGAGLPELRHQRHEQPGEESNMSALRV